MKASKFSDAQKAFILKQAADGMPVADIRWKAGISLATYFDWKRKYDGLLPPRIHVLLRREGWCINQKKTRRAYRALGLQLHNKTPKRRVEAKLREDRRVATQPNETWTMDFLHGMDVIDLSSIDAVVGQRGNQTFGFGRESTSVIANYVTWYESSGNTIVQADVNGNATADFVLVLTGTNLQLTASDFLL